MKSSEKMFFTTALVLMTTLTSCTIKQIPSSQRTITVSGSGKVEVASDQAEIILAVNTRSSDVNTAASDNADKMTKVVEAINGLGVGKDSISTTNYNIRQDVNNGVRGPYAVSNQVSVIIKDTKLIGPVIDAAVKAGANSLSSLTYSSSKYEEALKQAKLLAIKQAQDSASLLVNASGAKLGKILEINAMEGHSPYYAAEFKMDNGISGTPVNPQSTFVQVTVEATYQIN